MLTLWGNTYDPFRELEALRRQMNALAQEGFPTTNLGLLGTGGIPNVHMTDEGTALRIWAELPGVEVDSLEIDVDRTTLTLSGKRNTPTPEGYTAHRRERGDLEFTRSFSLPCRVDLEKTRASLDDGVLTVELPKRPEDTPKAITVQVK